MNLHALVSPCIAAVNPFITGTVAISTGATIDPDGTATPTFSTPYTTSMQVQPLSGPQLAQVAGLNLQGNIRAVYLNGFIEGLERVAGKGGDLLTFNGQTWLVVAVLETWDASGWCKVAVTEQNGS